MSTYAAQQSTWRYEQISSILQHGKNTPARAAAFQALDGVSVWDWNGRKTKLNKHTLRDWVNRFEEAGSLHALADKERADKGKKRTIISRQYDAAFPFEDAKLFLIADELATYIQGVIKGGASLTKTISFASRHLAELSKSEGFEPPNLKKLCQVPRRVVERHSHYRKVHQLKYDRKAINDTLPRQRRTKAGLLPMQVVTMDVHPVDVTVLREDGSIAHPRLIAFQDEATSRVWCELIFLEKSGDVRNADVIRAFARMVEHPEFGMPAMLYCDNGSEYNFVEFFHDALKLNACTSRDMRIVHALPYNASAKPIEGFFGRLETNYLNTLQGYVAGNRMDQKRPAPGKRQTPQVDFETFKQKFFQQLWAFETTVSSARTVNGISHKSVAAMRTLHRVC